MDGDSCPSSMNMAAFKWTAASIELNLRPSPTGKASSIKPKGKVKKRNVYIFNKL